MQIEDLGMMRIQTKDTADNLSGGTGPEHAWTLSIDRVCTGVSIARVCTGVSYYTQIHLRSCLWPHETTNVVVIICLQHMHTVVGSLHGC